MIYCSDAILSYRKAPHQPLAIPTHIPLHCFLNITKPLLLKCNMPRDFSSRKQEKFPHSAAISVPAEASAVCSSPFGTTKSNSNIPDMDKAWASIIQQESQLCRESSMPKWTHTGLGVRSSTFNLNSALMHRTPGWDSAPFCVKAFRC